jgi:hypothetical protein
VAALPGYPLIVKETPWTMQHVNCLWKKMLFDELRENFWIASDPCAFELECDTNFTNV